MDIRSHNNLLDSLKEYVKGDLLNNDNAYLCEECNKKVYIFLFISLNDRRLRRSIAAQRTGCDKVGQKMNSTR